MKDIESGCVLEMTTNETDEIAKCKAAGEALFGEVDNCLKPSKSLDESCECFSLLTTDNLDTVKSCNISGKNNIAKEAKKMCTSGFGKCKKAEDAVVDIVDQCKPERKCGGAGTKEEAEKQLKVLTPLSDALNNQGFENALKKAGLDTGTGSDGVLPTRRLRQAEDGEGEACKGILKDWKSFNSSADTAVPGVGGELDETETNNTIGTLDKINNNKNLDSDLASCKNETRQGITVTLVIVEIRFYVFWCGWFRVFVVEIRITIITATFFPEITATTAAPEVTTEATTEATITTAAAPGMRKREKYLRRAIFNH